MINSVCEDLKKYIQKTIDSLETQKAPGFLIQDQLDDILSGDNPICRECEIRCFKEEKAEV
jgi:hypothetical protein